MTRDEGRARLREARECLRSGWFKSPDPLRAAHRFELAAQAFKLAGDVQGRLEALAGLAECRHAGGQYAASAQALALQSECLLSLDDQVPGAVDLAKQASDRFLEAGDVSKASSVLYTCAQQVSRKGKASEDLAVSLMQDACDVLGDEKRVLHLDTFRQSFSFLVRVGRLPAALSMLDTLEAIHRGMGQGHSVHKCYLSRVILLLHAGDRYATCSVSTWPHTAAGGVQGGRQAGT